MEKGAIRHLETTGKSAANEEKEGKEMATLKRIPRAENVGRLRNYVFDKNTPPVLRVQRGEKFVAGSHRNLEAWPAFIYMGFEALFGHDRHCARV
jgi:hypothetical protein